MRYQIIQRTDGKFVCRVEKKFLWWKWWSPVWCHHDPHIDLERAFDSIEDAQNTLDYHLNQSKREEKVVQQIYHSD